MSENKKDTLGDRFKPRIPSPPPKSAKAGTAEADNEAVKVLSGDLKEKPIAWILRAAQHYEVTGVLLVGSQACAVSVQFGLGRAVHAFHPFCKGSEAIMDLFNWKDGRLKFEPGKHPEASSIQESTEELLVRGEQYVQNLQFLESQYINEMSFLVRPKDRLSEAEIKRRLSRGQRLLDHELQLEFYSNIYGTRNLKDTAEKLNLPHSQWVSIATNLLQLGILNSPDGRSLEYAEPTTTLELSALDPVEFQGPGSLTQEPPPGDWHTLSNQSDSTKNLFKASNDAIPVSHSQSDQSQSGSQTPVSPLAQTYLSNISQGPQSQAVQSSSFPPGAGISGPQPQQAPPVNFPPGPNFQAVAKSEVEQARQSQSNTLPPGWNSPPPGWEQAPPGWGVATPTTRKMFKLGVPDHRVILEPQQRDSVHEKLISPDTGILTFDVLHFFIEREFFRAARFKTTLSLMVFCVRFEDNQTQEVPAEACEQLTRGINQIKREVDMFGHFGSSSFGILLPMVESHQACSLAERINADLANFCPEFAQLKPILHFGIASVPKDATEMMGLVNAAQVSMMLAVRRNILLLEAGTLIAEQSKALQPAEPQSAPRGEPGAAPLSPGPPPPTPTPLVPKGSLRSLNLTPPAPPPPSPDASPGPAAPPSPDASPGPTAPPSPPLPPSPPGPPPPPGPPTPPLPRELGTPSGSPDVPQPAPADTPGRKLPPPPKWSAPPSAQQAEKEADKG